MGERRDVGGDPAFGSDRIGIGRDEDTVGQPLGLDPIGAGIHGEPARGAGVREIGRERRFQQSDIEPRVGLVGPDDGRRRVGRIVARDEDPERTRRARHALSGQRDEKPTDPIRLVARGDADDRGRGIDVTPDPHPRRAPVRYRRDWRDRHHGRQ